MSNMFLNIVSTFKGDGIRQATSQLGAFGSATKGLGLNLGKVGAALAGFGIAAKAVQFTNQSIDSARDLERNMFSLKTIFDEFTPTMTRFVQGAHEIGLSQKDAAKATVFLGSVLKQSGFSMEDVTEQSQKLVSLGVDLAATYGYDVQEALLGMTALFRGEYDPIEKFGVAMKQSEINAELAARGQNKLEGAARRNAEQIIRMELLYERAADATGAFTGQSGNLFVEQKKLQAQFENMQASIGNQLLPVMGALVQALVPLVDYIGPKIAEAVTASMPVLESFASLIKDMSDTTTTTGQTMEFLTGMLGSFFQIAADNFGVLVTLTGLFIGVGAAISIVNAALALTTGNWVIIGIGALIGAIILLNEATKQFGYEIGQSNEALRVTNREIEKTAEKAILLKSGGAFIRLTFQEASEEAKRLSLEVANADRAKLENLRNQINKVRISSAEAANEIRRMMAYAGVKPTVTPPPAPGTGTGTTGASGAASAAEQAANAAAEALQRAAEERARREKERLEKRKRAFESFRDAVQSLFGQIRESILSSFNLPDLGNSVNSITKNIQKLLTRTRAFAANITQLAGMGLNSTLLQQVIAAGPLGGSQLASALAGGGSDFINQLNAAYGEFGGLASGIAGVATQGAFANAQTVNNYSINVTGGVATSADVGRAVVNAISSYERQSGAAWRA
jgi:hypothetical protein